MLKEGLIAIILYEHNINEPKKKIEKIINTNKKGIKGGDFDKHDMFQAVMDYTDNILKDYGTNYYTEITAVKSLPKPLEDIVDSWLLKECIKFENKI